MVVGRLCCSWHEGAPWNSCKGWHRSASMHHPGYELNRRPSDWLALADGKLKWSQVTLEVVSGAPVWPRFLECSHQLDPQWHHGELA